MTIKKKFLLGLLSLVSILLLILFSKQPRLDRDWTADQQTLATAQVRDTSVEIRNIRNISYRSVTDYDVAFYDKTFDLNRIVSVDFLVEPFSGHKGPAHTLLSFGFDTPDGTREYVAISVEIPKEKGESFSPLKGLLRSYELVYVIADERDVIKLRSNYRKDPVYLYPMKTTPEKMRTLFLSMLTRANELGRKPAFYNTLTSTCTTNIVDHVNAIAPNRIPFSYKILLPGYSDELAYDVGLIDTTLPLSEIRNAYQVNALAQQYADAPDFSLKIRSGRPKP